MPWKVESVMKVREEFVRLACANETNMAELCRRYGISRKTGYKWLKRFKEKGRDALADQSKKPNTSPSETPDHVISKIIKVREKHPRWGGLKIHAVLGREAIEPPPSARCIQRVLKEQGYISEEKGACLAIKRFEHEAPNHLWQMDFKGYFLHEQGRCHPLTVLDDHSRFSLGLRACPNERGSTITPHLIEIFKRYGLPERINVDNGNPWGSPLENARYTFFSIWLIKLGIHVSYSRPSHPQTNGKEERFHRTLKEELINYSYFHDLAHIQKAFDEWRDTYNLERPHQAIGMKVPADRYVPSYRAYSEVIRSYEYATDYEVKKVDSRGRVSTARGAIFVGMPFSGEYLGIRTSGDAELKISVYFRQQKLGEIAESLIQKKRMINLYSKKTLFYW